MGQLVWQWLGLYYILPKLANLKDFLRQWGCLYDNDMGWKANCGAACMAVVGFVLYMTQVSSP